MLTWRSCSRDRRARLEEHAGEERERRGEREARRR
jgi:hypothetical protein